MVVEVTVYLADPDCVLHHGDALEVLRELPGESVHMCVTSPPFYGLRDYGVEGQIGLEDTPDEWCARLVDVFREVRRVLRPNGTCWIEVGDSYAGSWGAQSRKESVNSSVTHGRNEGESSAMDSNHSISANQILAHPKRTHTGSIPEGASFKPKDLIGAPWLLAFALRADGWYLRSCIIWAKPNPMPESVTDRPTSAHSYVFLLAKSASYFFDQEAVREPAEFGFSPSTGNDWRQGVGSAEREPERGRRTVTRGSDLLRRVPQGETLDGSGGEAPRGPDGRRKTSVQGQEGSLQHRDGERWPNPTGRNCRSVWTIPTEPYAQAHFATYPTELVRRCVLAGCPEGGTVLDPFAGSGTTLHVARKHGRRSIGIDLNESYCRLAADRLAQLSLLAEAT